MLFTLFSLWFTSIEVSSAAEKQIKVLLDGQLQHYDQPPVIEKGSTMVPFRGIFEALGADIKVDGKIITATTDTTTIIHTIGTSTSKVNGVTIEMARPSFVKNSRTLVPLRFISEALGAEVDWYSPESTVYIFTNPKVKESAKKHYGKTAQQLKDELIASSDGPLNDMEALLAVGAKYPNVFVWAAQYRNLDQIKLMLRYGTDANVLDSDGRTAMYYATAAGLKFRDSNGKLRNETEQQDLDLINLLIENGADVNFLGKKVNHIAIQDPIYYQRFDTVKLLLESGAHITPLSKTEQPILFYPIFDGAKEQKRNISMVKLLLEYGADVNAAYTHPGFGQLTPLAYASIQFHVATKVEDGVITESKAEPIDKELLKLLLDNGANPNDDVALKFANEAKDNEAIQILMEARNK